MSDELNQSFIHYTDSFIARAENGSLIRRAIDRRGIVQLVAGVAACLLLAFALLFHAWMRTQVTQDGYQLFELAKKHKALLGERERLTDQLARLRNPARIEQLAREQLKMGPASSDRVVVLPTTRIPVQDGPAQGSAAVAAK